MGVKLQPIVVKSGNEKGTSSSSSSKNSAEAAIHTFTVGHILKCPLLIISYELFRKYADVLNDVPKLDIIGRHSDPSLPSLQIHSHLYKSTAIHPPHTCSYTSSHANLTSSHFAHTFFSCILTSSHILAHTLTHALTPFSL